MIRPAAALALTTTLVACTAPGSGVVQAVAPSVEASPVPADGAASNRADYAMAASRSRRASTPSPTPRRSTPTAPPAPDVTGEGDTTARAGTGWPWAQLADCESGGNWSINTGNGFYGGLQFSLSSWRGVGGTGYPNQASVAEQIKRAVLLQRAQGWGAWPACSVAVGLR